MDRVSQAQELLKKGSKHAKVLFLEDVVLHESPECIDEVAKALGPVELSARAIGIAGRYRGIEYVRALLNNGATYQYNLSPDFKVKYDAYKGSATGYSTVGTEYLLMLILPSRKGECVCPLLTDDATGLYQVINHEDKLLSLEERIRCLDEIISFFSKIYIKDHEYLLSHLYEDSILYCPEMARHLREMGAGLCCQTTWKYVHKLPKGLLYESLKVLSEDSEFISGYYQVPCSMVEPTYPSNVIEILLEKYTVNGIKPVRLCKQAIDANNIDALAIYYNKGIIKNEREYNVILNYAKQSGKKGIVSFFSDIKRNERIIPNNRENASLYKESPGKWFLRRGEKLTGLTKIGIQEINEKGITRIAVPRKKDGYDLIGLTDTFFDCFESDVPGVNELIVPDIYINEEMGYPRFPGAKSIKTLRIIGPRDFSLTLGFRSCIGDSVEYLDILENPKYKSIDGIVFDNSVKKIIFYPRSRKGRSYEIPNSVNEIGRLAFQSARNLKSFTIPGHIVEIGWHAFFNCSFDRLEIDGNLKNIGDAFEGLHISQELILHEGIEDIGENSFRYCEAKQVVLPNSLKYVGKYAFGDSTSNFIFLSKETEIGPSAFRNCSYSQFSDVSKEMRVKIIDWGFSPYDCNFINEIHECTFITKEDAINIIKTYYGSDYPLDENMDFDSLRKILKIISQENCN